MRRILSVAIAFIFLTAPLSGCSYVETDAPPPLTFVRYQPILLNVGTVQFIEEYKSPQQKPYVEHLIPYSPAETMRIWVKDRIRATGNEHTLQVIIKDGSVMSTPLAQSSGVLGFMNITQDKRYDMNLVVEMRIYGRQSAMSEASIIVSANRSIVLSDIASREERTLAFYRMMADTMEQLNAQLEKNMFTYFGSFITYQ